MDYIKKCKNSYDFKKMLKKYNLTVDQYFDLRYEWDLLGGKNQLIVLKDEIEEETFLIREKKCYTCKYEYSETHNHRSDSLCTNKESPSYNSSINIFENVYCDKWEPKSHYEEKDNINDYK